MDSEPWFHSYDKNVPYHLVYEQISVVELFHKKVESNPQGTMLIDGKRKYSYRQVDLLSNRIRDGLAALGCGFGEPIAIILPNIPQFVISFMGILKLGGVVVALNPTYKSRELAYHLKDAGVKIAIALDVLEDTLTEIRKDASIKKIILTGEFEQMSLTDLDTQRPDENHNTDEWVLSLADMISIPDSSPRRRIIPSSANAILQYSGGTTGVPKAAIGTHANLIANVTQFATWLSGMSDPGKPILGAIPLFHVYGMVLCMMLSIMMGVPLVLVHSARDIEGIFKVIRNHAPGIFPCVPTLYQAMLSHPLLDGYRNDMKSLQVCISGSAPLAAKTKSAFEELIDGVLVEGYGLSEAPTATHCNPIINQNKTGSIGLPLPDVLCKIVDPANPALLRSIGEEGELLIRGPQIMTGYLNHDEETALVLRNGWLHTGDIAVMDEDGYFYIRGRIKDLIKVGGLQVWPQEIEEIIGRHPAVKEVGVAGVADDLSGERPVAWIVSKDERPLDLDEIRGLCSENLAGYKQPADLIIVPALPRTTVGKLLRRELIASYSR